MLSRNSSETIRWSHRTIYQTSRAGFLEATRALPPSTFLAWWALSLQEAGTVDAPSVYPDPSSGKTAGSYCGSRSPIFLIDLLGRRSHIDSRSCRAFGFVAVPNINRVRLRRHEDCAWKFAVGGYHTAISQTCSKTEFQ